ncbi:TetR/AcrR family transcriptional regulator [Mycolicibacterium sphagni]|uniref:TetR/AcrR family transcriptional regulator n=1 Tax=Mycolicibacterium sphagni TaxID=1786 RepID=UPI0021F38B0E|nr:TetR family transcriptional regulator [Mycolicibacterium sphagni]MCV7175187.1 TetR/AcrR family transcriptional regulator [Mycolicibacterium sphagni]
MRTTSELRDEILAAARTEFARYGFAGARIDRIASGASASKERLYAHFGDKEALFREVLAADIAEFFQAVTMRPDAVPEFVGDVFDLSMRRPEHHRMVAWAHLEGLTLDEPTADGQPLPELAIAAIVEAQAAGHVDPSWEPTDLLVVLFGIALAWAHFPDRAAADTSDAVLAHRRTTAVEAATRIVSPAR